MLLNFFGCVRTNTSKRLDHTFDFIIDIRTDAQIISTEISIRTTVPDQ